MTLYPDEAQDGCIRLWFNVTEREREISVLYIRVQVYTDNLVQYIVGLYYIFTNCMITRLKRPTTCS